MENWSRQYEDARKSLTIILRYEQVTGACPEDPGAILKGLLWDGLGNKIKQKKERFPESTLK